MKKYIALVLSIIAIMSCMAGCQLFGERSTSHEPILILEKTNPSKDAPDRDNWKSYKWTVYYDGTVEYEEEYSKSGVKNQESWTLTSEQVDQINDILYAKKNKESESNMNDSKARWTFTYMNDKGEILSEYTLYYSDDKSLTKIVNMLEH